MTVRDHDHGDTDPPGRAFHVIGEQPDALPAHTNPPAEQAVLGALLAAPELATSIQPELDPGDFYQPRHELIWDAIHTVATEGALPDPITVGTQLLHTGDLQRVGGAPYLHDLMAACPIPSQAKVYAGDVRDAARLRATRSVGLKLIQLADTADPTGIQTVLETSLDTLDKAAVRFGPATQTKPTGIRDLSWVAAGHWPQIPPPAWGRRADGHALFYSGRVNGIYGDPEAAKTWLAKKTCLEAIDTGRLAAVVDVDHNGQQLTIAHMLLLGARPADLANPDLFRYYEPDDDSELRAAITDLVARRPAVVVLDSIGEMMPMLGVKSIDNDELTAALRTIASPPAGAGACVITIDHLPKSHEARSTGFAIGGTAKKRALDGSFIYAEVRVQPAPGTVGKVTLRIEKDRPGELRKTCTGKYIGDFILDSTRENITIATIRGGTAITPDGTFRPTHLMETASRLIEDQAGVTAYTIEKTMHGKATAKRVAIQRLLEDGYITGMPGPRNSMRYTSLKPYRESEDDQI